MHIENRVFSHFCEVRPYGNDTLLFLAAKSTESEMNAQQLRGDESVQMSSARDMLLASSQMVQKQSQLIGGFCQPLADMLLVSEGAQKLWLAR